MSSPNPKRLPRPLQLADVEHHRAPYCQHLNACLNTARTWRGFSCRGCDAYVRAETEDFRYELLVLGAIGRWLVESDGTRGNGAWRKR